MIKPYYADDFVTIYQGDCRAILPELGKVDIVATDPPYGMGYESNWTTDHQKKGAIEGDDFYDCEMIAVMKSMARSALYAFGRWDNLTEGMPKPKSVIVWDKGGHSMGDLKHEYGRRWEMCCFWPGPNHSWGSTRPVDVISTKRVSPDALIHPTEKPVGLMTKILSHSSGSTVLDPYCGSGSTLRAAKDLGLSSIGIEIEERFCEIAAKRASQECFNF